MDVKVRRYSVNLGGKTYYHPDLFRYEGQHVLVELKGETADIYTTKGHLICSGLIEEKAIANESPTPRSTLTGAKGTCVVTRRTTNRRHFSVRECTIVFWGPATCKVKLRNGRIAYIDTDTFRPAGKKNALHEALETIYPEGHL
jgi:hypothetical protein